MQVGGMDELPSYDPAIDGPLEGPVSGFLPRPPRSLDYRYSSWSPAVHHREYHNFNRPSGYISAQEMAALQGEDELARLIRRIQNARSGGAEYDAKPPMPVQDEIFRRMMGR